MLDPEGRHLLLDALRPPPGYELDMAVGTTYTLDLYALLSAPVAFAMFDREAEDGSPRLDPIAALQALRRYAARITMFCHPDGISVPRDYRSLVVYLEHSIVPVMLPNPNATFHPKVWFIRYRQPNTEVTAYRLLCMSRNLTFDRSWDTILRLEGVLSDTVQHPELSEFAAALPRLAEPVKPISGERRAAIEALADELERVAWDAPDGMAIERFWPIGHDGRATWPFIGRLDRLFVASPFVTQGALTRLTKGVRGSILLSRPETFDQLGGNATAHLRERLVLSADTRETDLDQEGSPDDTASPSAVLEGLHAKLVVADVPYGGRVWTGSANLTDAAFSGNVEFMTELKGAKKVCGVDAIIGDQSKRMGLRKLVEPYEPATPEGRDLTELEQAERRLDRARRIIGRLRYTATCRKDDGGTFELELTGIPQENAPLDPADLEGLVATIRPVTLGDATATVIDVQPTGLTVRFALSYEGITPFFAVRLRPVDEAVVLDATFLINAELMGAPEDRAENVMVGLLRNRADLIRFLLLLLGNIGDAMAAMAGDGPGTPGGVHPWGTGSASDALLEPLVRAYSRDRSRLHEIRDVMAELAKTETGREILPEGWDAVWGPIESALNQEHTRMTTPEIDGTQMVADVMAGLKGFQVKTVKHVFRRMYEDPDPATRFLVADEVGLGKTLVARGLIAKAIEWHQVRKTKRIDVIYICSNADIARQNIRRLNVTGQGDFALATRITLLPLQLQQLTQNGLNFVSFTPGTSFNMASRGGISRERAVIFQLLKKALGADAMEHDGAYRLLRGGKGDKGFRDEVAWVGTQTLDRGLTKAFINEFRGRPELRKRFRQTIRRLRDPDADVDWNTKWNVIGELRETLAKACVEALEPDLVILDEFQRFKQLLDEPNPSDPDDIRALAHHMFNQTDPHTHEPVRILLLSATPYKMYTLSDEPDEDHYADFLQTCQFLMSQGGGRTVRC